MKPGILRIGDEFRFTKKAQEVLWAADNATHKVKEMVSRGKKEESVILGDGRPCHVDWLEKVESKSKIKTKSMQKRDLKKAEEAFRNFLTYMGQDLSQEGLRETPKRFTKYFDEVTSPKEFNFTTFKNEGMDEMIIQTNIPFTSSCEHHTCPFIGYGSIAYIPDKKIVGLSKLARTLDYFATRLQNQERITKQVAEFLNDKLKPKGVAVVLTAQHTCMSIRGVKKHDTNTTTSWMIGCFKEEMNCRQEFLSLIKHGK